MEWQHVYPVNDLKPHNTESMHCDCGPDIDWEHQIVIHNAWDMREAQEFINHTKLNGLKGEE